MSDLIEQPIQTTTGQDVPPPRHAAEVPPKAVAGTETAAPAAAAGDPGAIGLPSFLAGATALALVLIGVVPATASGASIPIVMTASGIGVMIGAIWAARLGQSAVAAVFAIFAGFWLSYAALVLGLTHNWYGISTAAVTNTQEIFLIAWLVVIGLLTLGSGRLPLIYTAVFALVDLVIVLVLLGTINGNAGLLKGGGWALIVIVALGGYLFVSGMNAATGGKPFPMGRPVLH